MLALTTENRDQREGFPRSFLPGMPEYVPGQMPGQMPEQMPGQMFNQATQQAPQRMQADETAPLRRVCDCIDANLLQADLSPDQIARDLGLSRATLYRVAQPLGGIQCFIRNRRLEYAFALIKTDAAAVRSISALAYDLGFGSENTFRRTFKDMFGISPSGARAKALA